MCVSGVNLGIVVVVESFKHKPNQLLLPFSYFLNSSNVSVHPSNILPLCLFCYTSHLQVTTQFTRLIAVFE